MSKLFNRFLLECSKLRESTDCTLRLNVIIDSKFAVILLLIVLVVLYQGRKGV